MLVGVPALICSGPPRADDANGRSAVDVDEQRRLRAAGRLAPLEEQRCDLRVSVRIHDLLHEEAACSIWLRQAQQHFSLRLVALGAESGQGQLRKTLAALRAEYEVPLRPQARQGHGAGEHGRAHPGPRASAALSAGRPQLRLRIHARQARDVEAARPVRLQRRQEVETLDVLAFNQHPPLRPRARLAPRPGQQQQGHVRGHRPVHAVVRLEEDELTVVGHSRGADAAGTSCQAQGVLAGQAAAAALCITQRTVEGQELPALRLLRDLIQHRAPDADLADTTCREHELLRQPRRVCHGPEAEPRFEDAQLRSWPLL
mmetsp:Transcript_54414/g.162078  ORF Transcript_54414/g.162078 Transcript_54414/m.162078 type:complete len:316 (+) Transcript_54414:916-1863(+)